MVWYGMDFNRLQSDFKEYHIAGKFGSLAVYVTTAKLKSTKISYSHILYIYTYGDPVPNCQI